MKDILGVCLCNTYKDENISKEKLKDITRGAWKIDKRKVNNIEYIVGFKDKQIKSVYKIKKDSPYEEKKTEKNGKIEKRYIFNVYDEIDIKIENKIKEKFNNKVLFHGAIKYLNSEDLSRM